MSFASVLSACWANVEVDESAVLLWPNRGEHIQGTFAARVLA